MTPRKEWLIAPRCCAGLHVELGGAATANYRTVRFGCGFIVLLLSTGWFMLITTLLHIPIYFLFFILLVHTDHTYCLHADYVRLFLSSACYTLTLFVPLQEDDIRGQLFTEPMLPAGGSGMEGG